MSNVERVKAQIRNGIYEIFGESGQLTTDGGYDVTWNPCSNPKYNDPRYRYVNIHGDGIHDSHIYDTESGRWVE